MPEVLDASWQNRPLYWSTIRYAQVWWTSDGAWVAMIRKNGMQPRMLRRIGVAYNVNRAIVREDRTSGAPDTNAEKVCSILNQACKKWPKDLLSRAQICGGIAEQMRRYTGEVERAPVSATTKFMWFLRPEGWTLFDRYAASGMGVASHLNRLQQMTTFYERLAQEGFPPLVAKMQAVVKDSHLPDLPAARILDALFMVRGGRWGDEDTTEPLDAFLTLLPVAVREPLKTLAQQLQDRFGDHPLASPTPPVVPRKIKAHA